MKAKVFDWYAVLYIFNFFFNSVNWFFLLKMPFSKKISSSRVKVFFVFFVISSTWSAIRQGGILNGDIALPEIRFVKDLYSAYKKVEGDRVSYSLIIKSKVFGVRINQGSIKLHFGYR